MAGCHCSALCVLNPVMIAVAVAYALFYIYLEPVAGLIAATLLFNGSRLATAFVASNENAAITATYIHITWC